MATLKCYYGIQLHIFVLVDTAFSVTATDLSQSLVLVSAGSLVLHVEHVVVGHSAVILNQVQLFGQRLKEIIVNNTDK